MDATIHDALDHSQTVDITTTGRRTGEAAPHRDRPPQPRRAARDQRHAQPADARLDPQPRGRPAADAPPQAGRPRGSSTATARVITDPVERRELLVGVARAWNRTDVDRMVVESPLIELTIPGYTAVAAPAA